MSLLEIKASEELLRKLPVRVTLMIKDIFFIERDGVPAFMITYENGHRSYFNNVYTFPTELDIARICVEAP